MIANEPAAVEIKRRQLSRCLEALLKEFGDVLLLDCLCDVFKDRLATEFEDPVKYLRTAAACAREANIYDPQPKK